MRVLHGILVLTLWLVMCLGASAADRPEKPSEWFCIKARAHRVLFPTDRAAEDAARALGASEATIAKAKRCSR